MTSDIPALSLFWPIKIGEGTPFSRRGSKGEPDGSNRITSNQSHLFYRAHERRFSDLPGLFLDRLHAGDLEEHRFAHVIVDEFQDLTAGEQDLMFRLCREDGQIVVLGDPRQSIYRFRGNDLEGLARIVELVPDPVRLVDIRMHDCQRCPRPIVIAANRLMALAGPHEMVAVSDIPGNIHVIVWESIEAEAEGMARAAIENFRVNPEDKHLVMATRRRFGYTFRDRVAELAPDLTVELNFSINIVDPQKMERIHIDPQKHSVVARPVDQRTQWDYVPYDGTQYRIATKLGVTVHTELLGNQQINGLKCWGQRTTYVYSPGTFQGNQQPLTRTLKVWHAKDLGADVRILAHDPNPEAGDQQTELIDITYSEPDPSIFALPTGYAVQSAQP
jgi:hypothetical protein